MPIKKLKSPRSPSLGRISSPRRNRRTKPPERTRGSPPSRTRSSKRSSQIHIPLQVGAKAHCLGGCPKSSSTHQNIFLFTHSNRINCLLKESEVHTDNDVANKENIINTLRKNKSNTKHFRKFFNNITFHIRDTNVEGEYEITVLDAGAENSDGNKIGNNDLDYYRDDEGIKYLKIVNDKLTESLEKNHIKNIIISRHGHGRHNDFSLKTAFAISDARLTDKGERETLATANRVKGVMHDLNIPLPNFVFTSELFRTMQTAAIFMRTLGFIDTRRTFHVVRCNHELSNDQLEEDMCNNSLENTLNSKTWGDWGKMVIRLGNSNFPKRLDNKIKSFCARNNKCKGKKSITLTSDELNCSTRNYTESCDEKGNMFDNISIVFYRHQKKDCDNYAVFDNVRKIISVERKIKKIKKRMTIRRTSKRFTKRR